LVSVMKMARLTEPALDAEHAGLMVKGIPTTQLPMNTYRANSWLERLFALPIEQWSE